MSEFFCCRNGSGCESYRTGMQVFFRQIKSEAGKIMLEREDAPLRWLFLLSGVLEVCKEGKKKIEVRECEMFLLPSSEYLLQARAKVSLIYLVSDRPTEYSMKMVANLAAKRRGSTNEIVKMKILPPIDLFLDLLKSYLQSGICCESLFEEKQEELFILILSKYSPSDLGNFFYSLNIHQDTDLKKFIIENCYRAKNVHELAEISGYSVSSFKRVFRDMFHESVYQWMQQQKAERLRNRLAAENVNLKVIYNDFGFSSPAHFTKFCKHWLGMTPTDYVKEVKARQNLLGL